MKAVAMLAALAFLSISGPTRAEPLYNVTDLGAGYALQANPDGSTYGVTGADGVTTYAFDKSPVAPTDHKLNA